MPIEHRTRRIAYWMPLDFDHFRRVLRGMTTAAANHPEIRLHYLGQLPEEEQARRLERADGVIAAITDPAIRDLFTAKSRYLVNVSGRLGNPVSPAVISDDEALGHAAADHLARRRYGRVATLGWPDLHFSEQRIAGFENRWHSLSPGPAPVRFLRTEMETCLSWVERERASAVYASNDFLARELIEAAEARGIEIPARLAVLGSDGDTFTSDLSPVPISSVETDAMRQGSVALETLLSMMRGRAVPDRTLIRPLGVVTRRSTDAAAVELPSLARALAFIHGPRIRFVGVDEVVRAAGVPRRTLERHFREHLRTTLLAELNLARLERARMLLQGTDRTIDAIARDVGYEDGHVLSVAVRRSLGLTPTQLRREAGRVAP